MHKLVLRSVYLSMLAWAPQRGPVRPFGCFVLGFLPVLSVSVYGVWVCVDVERVRSSSVFVGERILGETPTRCAHALAEICHAGLCVALWVCA